MDLNKLAAEANANAKEKGFWAIENADEKMIACMHCELSEALQEDRCGMPMLYVDDITLPEPVTDPHGFGGRKPEGVAVELADFVVRLLDYAAQHGINLPQSDAHWSFFVDKSLPQLVNHMHDTLGDAITVVNMFEKNTFGSIFARIVNTIAAWLEQRNVDLWQVVQIKMEYNRSRPKLHGRRY